MRKRDLKAQLDALAARLDELERVAYSRGRDEGRPEAEADGARLRVLLDAAKEKLYAAMAQRDEARADADALRAELAAMTEAREHGMSRVSDAYGVLSWHGAGPEEIADARVLLMDILRPGEPTDADRIAQRERLRSGRRLLPNGPAERSRIG